METQAAMKKQFLEKLKDDFPNPALVHPLSYFQERLEEFLKELRAAGHLRPDTPQTHVQTHNHKESHHHGKA